MERRKLLQSLAALPATVIRLNGKDVGQSYQVQSSKKYVIFIDPSVVDVAAFCHECHEFPAGTPVHCVAVPGSLDEAIRIFEIEGGEPSPRT